MKTESTLMQMLSTQMRYMSQRQGVLAQNIANADTPKYQAKDLKKLDFKDMMNAQSGNLPVAVTSLKHIAGPNRPGTFGTENERETFEVSPVGNNVSIEEQMASVSDTGAKYQVANALYKKFMNLHKIALGNN